jgi:alcohol dehydrogenase class IV
MSSSFFCPTKLVVSDDAAQDLILELKDASPESVFIVTDQGIMQNGIAAPILQALSDAGFKPAIYANVPGNPNIPDVKLALEAVQDRRISHIVAIGGGSVLDTAKAIGILLADENLDYEEVQWRRQQITKGSLPVIGIPTTAGTGSEVTHVAVVGDRNGFKMGVLNPALFLKSAIIDGKLMVSLPARLTATTGMDALVHSIEAFLSKKANSTADIFALGAIKSIVKWLPRAYKDGKDLAARNAMGIAATWAGIAFDQSSLGLVHALAGPVCGNYHLHHGLGVAVLLPATMDFNASAIPSERWESLRDALSLPADAQPQDLGNWTRTFLKSLEMPTQLSELGLTLDKIPMLAESAVKMAMIGFNVRPAGVEECKLVLTNGL